MATLVPEKIPTRASSGEKKIYNLLKRLPKDCTVFYEPLIKNRCPDFVVVSPRIGVSVIEVKDWGISYIECASNNTVHVRHHKKVEERQNPARQASGYQFDLLNLLNKSEKVRSIGQADKSFPDKLVFPVGYAVLMPNLKKSDVQEKGIGGIFSEKHYGFEEDIELLKNKNALEIEQFLLKKFPKKWKFKLLSPENVNWINDVINPVFKVSKVSKKSSTDIVNDKVSSENIEKITSEGGDFYGEYIPKSVYSIISDSFSQLIESNVESQKKIEKKRKAIEDLKQQISIAEMLIGADNSTKLKPNSLINNERNDLKTSKKSLTDTNCQNIEKYTKDIKRHTNLDDIDQAMAAFEKVKLHAVTAGLKLEYIQELKSLLAELDKAKLFRSKLNSVVALLNPEKVRKPTKMAEKKLAVVSS
ncbi:MAG: hypothetical protein CSB47_06870 [Proteobacteria bacterium]|nr:MAG: hypothetical protein CSB47_06870 [Pseudomonadota bacterium]